MNLRSMKLHFAPFLFSIATVSKNVTVLIKNHATRLMAFVGLRVVRQGGKVHLVMKRVRKEPLGPIVNSIVIVELVTRVIVSMVTVPVVFVLPDGKKITAAHHVMQGHMDKTVVFHVTVVTANLVIMSTVVVTFVLQDG